MDKAVTAIKWLKSQPDRALIYLDGQPWATVSLLTAGRFTVGDRIAPGEADNLRNAQEKHDAYQCALRWLGGRDRSVLEVRQRLNQRGFDRVAVDHTLTTLLDKNYLDDERFARNWVHDRTRHAPRGSRLMAQELKQKGIDGRVIASVLTRADEDALASSCLRRKRRRWRRLEDKVRRQKMLAYLSRKGFAYDVSLNAVESYRDQTD
ncbi:MAG: regulatory protein RecX [Desulfobacterales bacterium]|nr:regulatory protein RecX [Desulfobacterales bacterium]